MKLSKENLVFIDDYLIKNKVKHWDVRMELTDHIASLLEEENVTEENFKAELLKIHTSFGNKINNYRLNKDNTAWVKDNTIYHDNSGFQKLVQEKRKELKRKYGVAIVKTFKKLFTTPIFLVAYFGLIYSVIRFFEYLTLENVQVVFGVFCLMVFTFCIYLFISIKVKKSLALEVVGGMSFGFLGLFMQLPQLLLYSNIEETKAKIIMLSLMFVLAPIYIVGFLLFRAVAKEQKTYLNA
jgi:hypothetical protein